MGLKDSYNQIDSQILLMIPLPTVNQANSMLLQEESQRGMILNYSSVNSPLDSTSLSAI